MAVSQELIEEEYDELNELREELEEARRNKYDEAKELLGNFACSGFVFTDPLLLRIFSDLPNLTWWKFDIPIPNLEMAAGFMLFTTAIGRSINMLRYHGSVKFLEKEILAIRENS